MLLAGTILVFVPAFAGPTYYYFQTQDLPATLMLLPFIALAFFWWPRVRIPDQCPSLSSVFLLAGLLALLLWAGTHWLMLNYPLTRDEHMALFDAQILAKGQLAQPLASEWQGYQRALIPDWLLDLETSSLWVSHYLPGNAIMRVVFDAVGDPALMNPVLCGIGLIALYDIARRLFADTPAAVWLVLATYALSAQVLVNAMTSYAMTAHLTLNLIWLALFLRGKWWHHALVMLIGAWAIGLHQPTVHPLFAGPFILFLLLQRRWTLFTIYAAVYACAGLFWFSYPSLILSSFDMEAARQTSAGIVGYPDRILATLAKFDLVRTILMEFNILRFMVWMPLFALPLLVLAWPNIRKVDSLALPLFLGIVLMLLMRTILLPYQGHGWGYRSLHGLIGNISLLVGYGYHHWAKADRSRVDGTVALLGGGSAFMVLPFLLWSAHHFTAPYARLSAAIERQSTDFVVVDTHVSLAAIDQVRNRADLANRPLVLASSRLSHNQLAELCSRGSVTWLSASDIVATSLPMPSIQSPGPVGFNPIDFNDCLQPFDASIP